MSDTYTWVLYFVIVIVGLLATILYWVGRYFFNTDDEKATMVAGEEHEGQKTEKS